MVKHIEEFRAEFQTFLFVDRELFHQSRVPGFISWTLYDVASRVAMCSEDRVISKRAGVKQRSRDAGPGVGITRHVRARTIVADGAAAIAARDIVDVGRGVVIAGGGGEDAGHLPVANNLIRDA